MKRRNKVKDAGANQRRAVANVSDLMASEVLTASPQEPLGALRERMTHCGVHALPVVDEEDHPLGMVTVTDLLAEVSEDTPAEEIMSRDVTVIPAYSRVHDAARAMLNHHTHHLIVTHEKKVIGILSSFDILHLVADGRFVHKSAVRG